MALGEGVLKAESIPWSDLESLIKACDYLGYDDVLREIADKCIIPRIYGDWHKIRVRLSFKFEWCQPDPDNWEFDSTLLLDDDNFILNYYPYELIEEICRKLPREKLGDFIRSFGKHPLKRILVVNFYLKPISIS